MVGVTPLSLWSWIIPVHLTRLTGAVIVFTLCSLMSHWNFKTQLWANFPVSWLKPKQIPADIQHFWVIFSSISSTGSYGDADGSWRPLAGVHLGAAAAETADPGWSEKLAAVARCHSPTSWFHHWGLMKWSLSSITCEVFLYSLFPPENRTPWPLYVPERLISIEPREEVTVFLPSIQTSTRPPPERECSRWHHLCTACHCGSYFPKDYCLWPLPPGQSWYHSRRPWLQRLTGRRGGR